MNQINGVDTETSTKTYTIHYKYMQNKKFNKPHNYLASIRTQHGYLIFYNIKFWSWNVLDCISEFIWLHARKLTEYINVKAKMYKRQKIVLEK